MALFGLWKRVEPVNDLADTLAELTRRVADLEALQVSREIEWKETRDKLLRHLKRVSELDRRTGDGGSPARRALLSAKFPNMREG